MEDKVYEWPGFKGLDLKDSPVQVPPQFARLVNFIDISLLGAIKKALGPEEINSTRMTVAANILGVYEYVQTDGDKFLIIYRSDGKFLKYNSGTGAFDDITPSSGISIASNIRPTFATFNNLCVVGDGVNVPFYYYDAVVSADCFELGVKAPTTAPSVVDTGTGSFSAVTGYKYLITFVSDTGAESNGGPESVSTGPFTNVDYVALTSIPVNSDAKQNVVARKIYRTDDGGIVFYYLDTINDNTTTTYDDDADDSELGERLVEERETPLAGLTGFTEYNNSLYAFIGYNLWHSKLYEGEAWGAFNIEPIVPGDGTNITGLGLLNDLVIFKERSIHSWYGYPGMFARMRRATGIGTLSHNTIKNVDLLQGGNVLMFLDKSGVYIFDGQEPYYVSREIEPIFRGTDARYVFNAAQGHKACSEYSFVDKKYFLSVAVNGASENNALLIYDQYAQSWGVREPFYVGALTLRTDTQNELDTVIGGDSRNGDGDNLGGHVFSVEGVNDYLGLDYVGEYITAWNRLDWPHMKQGKYLELDFDTLGEYPLLVNVYIDGSEIPSLTISVDLSPGGALWDDDDAIWDEVSFAASTYKTYIKGLERLKFRFISLGFKTTSKDRPWSLYNARIRYVPLVPTGERQ